MNENCEDVIVPGQGLRRVNILDLQIAIGFSGDFYHFTILPFYHEEIWIFTVYWFSTVEAVFCDHFVTEMISKRYYVNIFCMSQSDHIKWLLL